MNEVHGQWQVYEFHIEYGELKYTEIKAQLYTQGWVRGWHNSRFDIMAEERYNRKRGRTGVRWTGD